MGGTFQSPKFFVSLNYFHKRIAGRYKYEGGREKIHSTQNKQNSDEFFSEKVIITVFTTRYKKLGNARELFFRARAEPSLSSTKRFRARAFSSP